MESEVGNVVETFASRIEQDRSWGEPSVLIRCPVCGDNYQHHGITTTFDRGEDGPTTAFQNGGRAVEHIANPSPRRDAVRIEFSGECGHEWWLDIVQHKGETYAFSRVDLKGMPYRDYLLRTDHWQRCRADALESAGYRCQLCNSSERLEVHHRTYERRGEELPSDLIVLCKSCHSTFHARMNGHGANGTARP